MSYPIVIESAPDLAQLVGDAYEFAYQHLDDLDDLWESAEILADAFVAAHEQGDPRG